MRASSDHGGGGEEQRGEKKNRGERGGGWEGERRGARVRVRGRLLVIKGEQVGSGVAWRRRHVRALAPAP